MNKNVIKVAGLTLFLTCSTVVKAEPASAESIRQLMQATGAGEMGRQLTNQMIPALKQMLPDASEQFWIEVRQEINIEELANLIVPLYQKHLTEEDVAALNEFYTTPAGKKLIAIQPIIMRESMIIGRLWGEQMAQRIIAKYQTGRQN